MRVIAGKARRLTLKTLPGMDIRPTTDKTKETLFNVLMPDIYDCVFLDLFSGTGAIAIEALSRGAQKAVLVENSRASLGCIKDNLKATHLEDNAEIIGMDALSALRTLNDRNYKFDIIFMDPPYDHELERDVLVRLSNSNLVNENTIIVVEASLKTDFEYLRETRFEIYKIKEYKNNQHVFMHVSSVSNTEI